MSKWLTQYNSQGRLGCAAITRNLQILVVYFMYIAGQLGALLHSIPPLCGTKADKAVFILNGRSRRVSGGWQCLWLQHPLMLGGWVFILLFVLALNIWYLCAHHSSCFNPSPYLYSCHTSSKEMANHFSILAWKILWTEEPGGLQSLGSQEPDMT